jgi:DNA-binding beta-propeller fold protein YncE
MVAGLGVVHAPGPVNQSHTENAGPVMLLRLRVLPVIGALGGALLGGGLLGAARPTDGSVAVARCCPTTPLPVGRRVTAKVVWPAPPEPARIAYAGFLRSDLELGRKESFFARLKQALAGTEKSVVALQRPYDVYTDDADRMYVSDGSLSRVVVFDPKTKATRFLGTEGHGRLGKPMGLGGDGKQVYVADPAAKRVVVFRADGEFVRAFGGDAVLLNPVDVAVDAARGRVYVADSYLHQVVVFDLAGNVVQRIGRDAGDIAKKKNVVALLTPRTHSEATRLQYGDAPAAAAGGREANGSVAAHLPPGYIAEPRDLTENRGSGPGEFRYPAHVAVGPGGRMYVSDGMNFRVQAFDSAGRPLGAVGRLGDTPGSFARPKGVAVDSEGHLFVVDAAFNNLQVFDDQGRLLLAFGGMGRGHGELWLPLGLHIDRQDRIYVADRFNKRVQIYEFLSDAARAAGAGAGARGRS